MPRREINIVLVCSILANITAIITILQINVKLFLFLDQRKRQTENVAISAINDINLLSRFIKHRKRRKNWMKKVLGKTRQNFVVVGVFVKWFIS